MFSRLQPAKFKPPQFCRLKIKCATIEQIKKRKVINFIKNNWLKILITLPIAVFLLLALDHFTFKIFEKNQKENSYKTEQGQDNKTNRYRRSADGGDAEKRLKLSDGKILSNRQCKGSQKPKLSALPMNYGDFAMILPYGLVTDDHVTPIDHQYFSPTVFNSPRDAYNVYAMADARINTVEERRTPRGAEYRLVFTMSCKLFYYYDLVTSLEPKIMSAWQASKAGRKTIDIPVKAGELIGKIGGQTLDFAVWDMDVNLPGFVNPKNYQKFEPWKIHTADPLNYYTAELKQKILTKYLREAEPRSGKIDYDIDGKLIGNWFEEGSGGYGSGGQNKKYYQGHLSIAPDYLDPESIVVSIGDYQGEPKQFGVLGNAPNPKEIDVSSGLVKYDLVIKDWIGADGKRWNRMSLIKGVKAKNQSQVQGVALFQLLASRRLKAEFIPNKRSSQVSGFSEKAKIFER